MEKFPNAQKLEWRIMCLKVHMSMLGDLKFKGLVKTGQIVTAHKVNKEKKFLDGRAREKKKSDRGSQYHKFK